MKTLDELRETQGVTVVTDNVVTVWLSPLPNWYGMVAKELNGENIPCVRCEHEVEVHYPRVVGRGITTPDVADGAYILPAEAQVEIGHRYFAFRCPQCGLVQLWNNYDSPVQLSEANAKVLEEEVK